MDGVPFLVPPGWVDVWNIRGLHEWFRILLYEDGTRRFEHTCRRRPDFVVVCAPALSEGHTIAERDIRPSILCPDCGLHGFVVNSKWVSVV